MPKTLVGRSGRSSSLTFLRSLIRLFVALFAETAYIKYN